MQKESLTALVRQHLETRLAASSGRSAHTVYGGHEHVLRQTLIALRAGRSLDEHENPGEATVQVLQGRVTLVTGENRWNGSPGDLDHHTNTHNHRGFPRCLACRQGDELICIRTWEGPPTGVVGDSPRSRHLLSMLGT